MSYIVRVTIRENDTLVLFITSWNANQVAMYLNNLIDKKDTSDKLVYPDLGWEMDGTGQPATGAMYYFDVIEAIDRFVDGKLCG